MLQKFKNYRVLVLLVSLLFVTAGCGSIGSNSSADDKNSGSIKLTISQKNSTKTILPGIDMIPASYTITGAGPDAAEFARSITDVSAEIPELAFGNWIVTVDALNANNQVIARGSEAVTVHTGETATADITVTPLAGNGTLNVTLQWNSDDTEVPSIEAQLINSSDVVQDLTFTISSIEGTSTGTFSDSALPAGYYVLSVKLLDNNIQTMGAVEIVRIVEGETSTGSFIFNEINKPGGTIMANIIADMEEPIEVSMSDIPAELAKGTTPSVTASVPDGVGDVRYTWFINGEQKHIGSTADPVYTIPVDTLKTDGVYRIDVVAFTLDGKRGGSATDTFSVIEAEPQPGCTENVWEGNYTILTQAHIDALSGYAKITGNLEIGDSQAFMNNETPVETTFTNLAGLECLTRIEGYLVIINNNSLTNLTGLSNLTHIEKYVAVLTNNALTSLAGLNNLEVVNGLWEVGSVRMSMMFQENKALTDAGDFNKISSLSGGLAYLGNRVVSINGFNNLTSIGDELIFSEEPALKSIEGFSKLTSIDGRFSITKNDILTNIDGLNNITSVNHYLDIEENNALTSIGGFNELDNSVQVLSISSNPALTSIDGFNKLTSITSYFNITSNTALETINGFSSLTYIGNEIKIFRNTVLMNIEGFPALCSVGGYFTISENPELCTNIAEEFRDQVQNCSGGGIGGSISIIENKICP